MGDLDLTPINLTVNQTNAPDVGVLTSKVVEGGTGVFDILMDVTKLHITKEFDDDRITGPEYTKLYLGSLQAVLQASIAFIADHSNNAKTNAEIGLIRQKIVTELSMTDEDIPVGLGFNNGITIAGLNKALTDKALSEDILLGQKTATELAATGDVLPAGLGENVSTVIGGTVAAQLSKFGAEKTLLDQKTVTALTQTSDNIPAGSGLNITTAVEGVVKTQKDLHIKQTDGFDRDAEQKVLKIMVDTWTVRRTTDEGTTVSANGLQDSEINKILNKAKEGIGSTAFNPELRLYFDTGTAAFKIGETVTGDTSTDTGVVDALYIESGSWATNDAAGYLILTSCVVGDYQDNETITSASGSATSAGVVGQYSS